MPESREGSDAQDRRSVVRDSLGVGIATGVYGTSFGAIAVGTGLSVTQTCAMSLLIFTGASQFAMVGVLASGGNPFSGAFTALLLGTRNTLYGLRLGPLLQFSRPRRAVSAHLVIDESTAMAVIRPTTELARTGFYWTGLSVFVLWNLFTALGAVAGNTLGDPRDFGLDAAVGAAFLALLWPRLTVRRSQGVGLIAAALALALVPITAAGVPVLAAGAVALLAGVLLRDREEEPS
ncbi:MAG: AzlC family ABC transporter permease [Nocardioides sp.]